MWLGHRTQLSKVGLDSKVTGKTRPALVEIWEQFKDDQVRVRLRSCRTKHQVRVFALISSIVFGVCLVHDGQGAKMAVVAIVVFAFVGCARYGTERATQVEYGGASAGKIAHNIVQQSCFNVGVFDSGGQANNKSIMRDTHLLFQPPVILAENVRYPPPSQTTSTCWPPVSTPTSCTSRTSPSTSSSR